MIMLGTTPRHLSKSSALGALALAALTLPLTPSWAQKPEEHTQEIVTIVKTDQDLAVKPAEAANTDIELILTTDGHVDKIKADSLDKAINEIKDRIKTAVKENQDSKESDARVKALKQALGNLEKTRLNFIVTRDGRDGDGDAKADQKQIVIRKLEDAGLGKLTDEQKAKMEKARARVEALRNELNSTQKKLREAEMDLRKIQGDSLGRLGTEKRTITRIMPRMELRTERREESSSNVERQQKQAAEHAAVAERHQKQAAEHAAHQAQLKKRLAAEHAAQLEKLAKVREDGALKPSERERLNVLEKRMAELLEEVSRLKKEGK